MNQNLLKKVLPFLLCLIMLVSFSTELIHAVPIQEIDSNSMIARNTLIFDNTIISKIKFERISGSSAINLTETFNKGLNVNVLNVEFPNKSRPDDSFAIYYDYVGTFKNQRVGAKITVSNIRYKKNKYFPGTSEIQAIKFAHAIYRGVWHWHTESCDYHISFFKEGNPNARVYIQEAYTTFGSLNYYDREPDGTLMAEAVAPLSPIKNVYTLKRNRDKPEEVISNIVQENWNGIECYHATTNKGFKDELGHPNFPANGVSFDFKGEIAFKIISGNGSLWFTFDTAPLLLAEPERPRKTASLEYANPNTGVTFTISQKSHILGIDAYVRYSSFTIEDVLDPNFIYYSAYMTDSSGRTLNSSECQISYDPGSRKVSGSLTSAFLGSMPMNGETYNLIIRVKTSPNFNISTPNTGKTVINGHGFLSNEVKVKPLFKVTTEVVNGTISSSQFNIKTGENRRINYSPKPEYRIKSITVDGKNQNIQSFKNGYSFNNINANHHIKVVYEPIPSFKITTEVVNGQITPSINKVFIGESRTIKYSPNPEHRIKSITVDGKNQSIQSFRDKYSFNNINANHHIKVVYEPIPRFKITTEVVNGKITPSIDKVFIGENRTIKYAPNEGYMIKSITVDSIPQNINSFLHEYPFNNINANHHIKVIYEPIPHKSITVTKKWIDRNNQYSTRPNFLNINVLQNGNVYRELIFSSTSEFIVDDETWAKTISVPICDSARNNFIYTIEEHPSDYMKINYNSPVYDQDKLTVTNGTFFDTKNEIPHYTVTINKNIINNQNNPVTTDDFTKIKLDPFKTYEFPIVLRAYEHEVVNNKKDPIFELNGNNLTGITYRGIVTSNGNLVFNNIPAGKYMVEELNTQYFDFVNMKEIKASENVSLEYIDGHYIFTFHELSTESEEIEINVTNKIKDTRSYDEKVEKANKFKK